MFDIQMKHKSSLLHSLSKLEPILFLGHHPHVLQPMKWIEQPDGKLGLVVYSLGNFLSGQIRDYKDIGGMIEIKVRKRNGERNTVNEKRL